MRKPDDNTKTYIVVAVAAAVVSALTAAYILQRRGLLTRPQVVTVQEMLEKCHDQVRQIETKLDDLRASGLSA